MTHCYASWRASGSATNTDYFADTIGEQPACGKALHCTHGRADTGVHSIDAKGIQEAELSLDHIEYGQDWEACRETQTRRWIDGGWAGGAVAAADDVCAYDEEVICVQGLSWTDEFFPPPWSGIQGSGGCVGGSRQACVEKDDVVSGGRQGAPRLVSDVEGGKGGCIG